MADDPIAAGARSVQIPARIHAVRLGGRQVLDGLHEQIRAAFPDHRLLDLSAVYASTWKGRRAAATP